MKGDGRCRGHLAGDQPEWEDERQRLSRNPRNLILVRLVDDGQPGIEHSGRVIDAIVTDDVPAVRLRTWPGKYEHRGRLLAHLAPGALYVCDDLLPQPTWPHDHRRRVERFLDEITGDSVLVHTLMGWASGLVVAARRPDPA
jgi:hypothetical protein